MESFWNYLSTVVSSARQFLRAIVALCRHLLSWRVKRKKIPRACSTLGQTCQCQGRRRLRTRGVNHNWLQINFFNQYFCFALRPDHLNGHIKQVHTTERPHKCQVNCHLLKFASHFAPYTDCSFILLDLQCLFCYKRSPPLTPRLPRGQNPLQSLWQVSPSCLHDGPPEETHWRNAQLLRNLQQRFVSCFSTVAAQACVHNTKVEEEPNRSWWSAKSSTCFLGSPTHLDHFPLAFK